MKEKGKLCPSEYVGPKECPDCQTRIDTDGQPDDYWCDNCQSTCSDYFTHFGAAEEYLRVIRFVETQDGGVRRFLVLDNRDTSGVEWDVDTAKRLLAEADIPEDKMEQTVFEACAIADHKENELLMEPKVRALREAEAAAEAKVEREWAEAAGVPPEMLDEAFPAPSGRW